MLDELGIVELEIRAPFLFEDSPERTWMRDGVRVSVPAALQLLRQAMNAATAGTRAAGWLLQTADGLVFRPTWDSAVKLLAPPQLVDVPALARRFRVTCQEAEWGRADNLAPVPYEPFGPTFLSELLHRCDSDAGALLTEKWANGPGGRRGQILQRDTDIDSLVRELRPRSVLLLIDRPDLRRIPALTQLHLDELAGVPAEAEVLWPALALLPDTQSSWYELQDAQYWADSRGRDPGAVSGHVPSLFMPANRWYSAPRPSRCAVPDADGAVRCVYRDGPDSALG
ncbi:hypothetical protein [Kribbella sp. NPDC051770]|uniref:hypothetical protein n=1 Tax=Kribbella sp. NPDC051770 TaxID=3155413 RepID=UPI00341D5C63